MGLVNVILYAQWSQNLTYTVTYDGNWNAGGGVPIDNNNYERGMTVTVASAGTLVRSGYTFVGWNTAANGSGIERAPGSTFTMGLVNVILYAQWSQNPTYTVTYNGNGNTSGGIPIDSNNYETGMTVTVASAGTLVRSGYTFVGWNTAANGSGIECAPGSTFTMGSVNVILYAHWLSIPEINIKHDSIDILSGTGSYSLGNVEINTSINTTFKIENLGSAILNLTAIPAIYINGAPSQFNVVLLSTTTIAPGDYATLIISFNPTSLGNKTANITIYNNDSDENPYTFILNGSSILKYTITYDGNGSTGGSVPTDSTRYEQGQSITVLGNTGNLVKADYYIFKGWNMQADGNGITYTQGQTFTMGSANVTLYAKWDPTFTITYDGNDSTGGSVPADTNRYEQGKIVTVPGNSGNLEKSTYIFKGWNMQADGNGITYTQGQTFTMGSANVTLYVKWDPTFTVTYDGNGSTGGSVPADTNRYEQGKIVTVPGNSGNLIKIQDGISLLFTGWNSALDGSGTSYIETQSFSMGISNVNLYAQWSIIRGIGPAGGLIFYDKGYFSDGWRYMEAAPANQSDEIQWGGYGIIVGVYSQAARYIGAGVANTNAIVGVLGEGVYAAKLCDDLVLNSYSDWFLPSDQELHAMFQNLDQYGSGYFEGYPPYWSSTEMDFNASIYAYTCYFRGEEFTGGSLKSNNLRVRAARRF